MVQFNIVLILLCLSFANTNEATTTEPNDLETTTTITDKIDDDDVAVTQMILPNNHDLQETMDFPVNRPPNPFFGIDQAPNIFQNIFNQLFRPVKTAGKTYGPNIIAIIGDKPYISMEIFNKFSPFKWLMTAFQGKIQNLCGILAPPSYGLPMGNPQNILNQFLDEHLKPILPSGQGSTILEPSAPIRAYNFPAFYRKGRS